MSDETVYAKSVTPTSLGYKYWRSYTDCMNKSVSSLTSETWEWQMIDFVTGLKVQDGVLRVWHVTDDTRYTIIDKISQALSEVDVPTDLILVDVGQDVDWMSIIMLVQKGSFDTKLVAQH